MRTCAINELEIGEIVLARYPNGEMGTAIIEYIENRIILLSSNWAGEKIQGKFNIYMESDYTPNLLKIRSEWDAEVNV